MAAMVLGLTPIIPSIFHTEPQQAPQLKLILWLIGLQAAAGFPFSIFGGVIQGLQDFHVRNVITILNAVLRLLGTIFLLTVGFGLISLLVLEFGLSAIGWVLQVGWIKKRIPALRLHPNLYDSEERKQLFRFSGTMLLWRVAGMLVHRSNHIIIGLFLPLSSITLFEIGRKAAESPRMGFMSFLSPLLPASSELNAQNKTASMKEVYLTGTKFTLAFYIGGAGVLFIWGEDFIRLWMGNQFSSAVTIMHILLLGNLYQSQNVVAHVMLAGMGVLKAFTRVMAGYPIVNLILSFAFIRIFGLLGVAWAVTLTFIVMETYLTSQVLRIFKLSFVDLLRSCYLPTFISLVPAAGVSYGLHQVLFVTSWQQLAGVGAVFLLIYGGTFWVFGISKDQKRSLHATLNAFIHLRKPTVTRV